MAEKCNSSSDCDLSSIDTSGPCFFHMVIPTTLSSDPRRLRQLFLTWINESAVNIEERDFEKSRLDLTVRTFTSDEIELMKKGVERYIRFTGCTFATAELFLNNIFPKKLDLYSCKWPLTRDGKLEIRECIFHDDIEFEISSNPLIFVSCEFHGDVIVNKAAYSKAKSPQCTFEKCIFESSRIISIGGKCNFDLGDKSVIRTSAIIDANFGHVRLDGISFLDMTTIGVSKDSDLLLLAAFVYKGLLLSGGYGSSPKPTMLFDGIQIYGDSKIIFQNIDLTDFKSENYRFWSAVFRGVKFYQIHKRYSLKSESDIRDELQGTSQKNISSLRERIETLQESYKNIKLSFDKNAQYRSANDFHTGELWAQWQLHRLETQGLIRPFRLLFSWHTWYWLISDFGQSMRRPFCWLLGSLIIGGFFKQYSE